MNVHEFQAKATLAVYKAPVASGFPASTAAEARAAAERLPGPVYVVKSQIHAGGRGKGTFKEAEAGSGGGVRLARSAAEVVLYAEQMLGKTLVTVQT
ncbi:MAG: ATP-grasp domain-containing protein, partial [Methylovirgula sp.]